MMKKIILGLVAVAAIGAAVPASAQIVVRENRHGDVVVRQAGVVEHRGFHHRHRVVYFDRWHHRHVEWR